MVKPNKSNKPTTKRTKQPQSSLQQAVANPKTDKGQKEREQMTKNSSRNDPNHSVMSESLHSEVRSSESDEHYESSFVSHSTGMPDASMVLDTSILNASMQSIPESEIVFSPEHPKPLQQFDDDLLSMGKELSPANVPLPLSPSSYSQKVAAKSYSAAAKTPLVPPSSPNKFLTTKQAGVVKQPHLKPSPKPTAATKNPYAQDSFSKLTKRGTMMRYDLRRIVVPASNEPIGTLIDALKEFVTMLRKVDASIIVYPWQQSKFGVLKEITDPTRNFPSDYESIRQYFNNFLPLRKGGEVFGQVYLGFSTDFKTIRENLYWQYDDDSSARPQLWPLPLQREKTIKLGWFLYSLPTMDREQLTQEIYNRTKVQVGLRWQMISLGKSGQLTEEQKVRAILHLEVDATTHHRDSPIIQKLYATVSTKKGVMDYPLGIRLRLVPVISDVLDPRAKSQVEYLRNRQDAFLKYCLSAECWDIQGLDTASDSFGGWTLRELILQIPVNPSNWDIKLFVSADKQWEKQSIKLTFLPQYEDVARNVVASILTFCRWMVELMLEPHLIQGMDKVFTPQAVQRANECKYDQEAGVIISEHDYYCGTLLSLEADYDLTEFATRDVEAKAEAQDVVITNTPTTPKPKRVVHAPSTDDSIKTFGADAFPTHLSTSTDGFSSYSTQTTDQDLNARIDFLIQQKLSSLTATPPGGGGPV